MNLNDKRNNIIDEIMVIEQETYPINYRLWKKHQGICKVAKDKKTLLIKKLCNIHKEIKSQLK